MAVIFATKNGNWNDATVWSNGAIPASDDDVHANGFTIQLNADVNVNTLNNTASVNRLQYMNVPKMLNNTTPTGYLANASANQSTAYIAFDQSLGSAFNSGTINNWLSFQYTTTKINVRYAMNFQTGGLNATGWRYEGSNDGVNYTTLHTVTGNAINNYVSPLLTFTTPYLYYRIFITAQAYAPGSYILSFEMTEDTNPNPIFGQTAGGTFTNTSTRTVILNGTDGCIFSAGGTVITAAQNTTDILSITSTYNKLTNYTFTSATSTSAIQTTGTGITNITGDLYNVSNVSYDQSRVVYVNSNATVNIIGSLFGGTSTTAGAILTSSSWTTSTITVTGSVNAGNFYGNSYAITLFGTGTLTVIGTINAGLAHAVWVIGNPTININGIVNANATNVTSGIFMSSASANSLVNLFAGAILNNKGLYSPIISRRLRLNQNANVQWVFQDTTNTDVALSTGTPAGGVYPAASDVRYNTPYGANPTVYGTLRVPPPNSVALNVLTDNTAGSAYLTPIDFWSVQTALLTSSGTIGERLKNASTVQTTGDQIASYQV